MIHALALINFLGLLFIIKRDRLISVTSIVYFIFLFYGFSFYIDHVIFGIDNIFIRGLGGLKIDDVEYLYISFFYTFFLVSFVISSSTKSRRDFATTIYKYNNNKVYLTILYTFFSLILIYLVGELIFLSRLSKMEFLNSNKLISIIASYSTFGLIFILVKRHHSKNKIFFELPFLLIFILYGLAEGGREIFLYIFLCFLFLRKNLKIKLYQILLGLLIYFFIISWKFFNIYVIGLGDYSLFIQEILRAQIFSFTSADPTASLLILTNYLRDSSFYEQFHFSYYYNTIQQFLSFFNIVDYTSISKQVVRNYSSLTFYRGGGFAFSGILESILNFGYFGPVLLGLTLGRISASIYNLIYSNKFNYNILSIFFVILCMKLVRTELAVVLKLYLLPMIITYILFYRFSFNYREQNEN